MTANDQFEKVYEALKRLSRDTRVMVSRWNCVAPEDRESWFDERWKQLRCLRSVPLVRTAGFRFGVEGAGIADPVGFCVEIGDAIEELQASETWSTAGGPNEKSKAFESFMWRLHIGVESKNKTEMPTVPTSKANDPAESNSKTENIRPGPKRSAVRIANDALVSRLWNEYVGEMKEERTRPLRKKAAKCWTEDRDDVGFLTEGLENPIDYGKIAKRIELAVKRHGNTATS